MKTQREKEETHSSSSYTLGVEEAERESWIRENGEPKYMGSRRDPLPAIDDPANDLASVDFAAVRVGCKLDHLSDLLKCLGELYEQCDDSQSEKQEPIIGDEVQRGKGEAAS